MTIARNRASLVALAQVQIITSAFGDEKLPGWGRVFASSGMESQKSRTPGVLAGTLAYFPQQARAAVSAFSS
jgi:hypothetical protein